MVSPIPLVSTIWVATIVINRGVRGVMPPCGLFNLPPCQGPYPLAKFFPVSKKILKFVLKSTKIAKLC